MSVSDSSASHSTPLRRVMIAGASGLVGHHILAGLLADDTVSEVHALCRRNLAVKHPKLCVHLVDFNDLPPLMLGAILPLNWRPVAAQQVAAVLLTELPLSHGKKVLSSAEIQN
nr:hypothetical protein [uncultured Desulfobulbus sp.]